MKKRPGLAHLKKFNYEIAQKYNIRLPTYLDMTSSTSRCEVYGSLGYLCDHGQYEIFNIRYRQR